MATFVRLSSASARRRLWSMTPLMPSRTSLMNFSTMPSKARAEARDEYKKSKQNNPSIDTKLKDSPDDVPKRRRLSEVSISLFPLPLFDAFQFIEFYVIFRSQYPRYLNQNTHYDGSNQSLLIKQRSVRLSNFLLKMVSLA